MSISHAVSLIVVAGDVPHADLHEIPLRLGAGEKIGKWAAQLDTALIGLPDPSIVIAEGIAAIAFAHWAQLSPPVYWRHIAGAVLLDPAERREWAQVGLASSPATPLPFPSLLVNSESSAAADQLDLAGRWHSRFLTRDGALNATADRGSGDTIEASLLAALHFCLAPRRWSSRTLMPRITELTSLLGR